ncbi:MAG: rRNA maturation RNase YbeY [Oscillospiraceae bacterium]|nr:rRNA maturation RNase YbeY [Oscillospiraceae bacterium]
MVIKMVNFKLFYDDKVKSGLNFRPLAYKTCCKVLQHEKYPYVSEASMTLVSDEDIRTLNKQYRKIDSSTDVLSFLMGEPNYEDKSVVLGDVIISVPTAVRQANQYGHSLEREMAFLTVHGMLHLLGYDHINKSDEQIMFAKQEQILQKLGIIR